jgi:hypothetical protein
MKNTVFWDIRTHFMPHMKRSASPLLSPAGLYYIRFQGFTAVTKFFMPYSVFDLNVKLVYQQLL